ncbi:hypothetical protein JAAARDRAFT_38264 [Jaapia argillacea MUCL 33604]|uniref:Uncharacterized protein n=1 Tax=Jaapia argillacea MUCL 33604 TaxID=933084 RepID=A0A067PW46_9AGAM|nr:hypothetical protein JAAARDRAFT_38264 [Jaapia argillacea MUCL 33604]
MSTFSGAKRYCAQLYRLWPSKEDNDTINFCGCRGTWNVVWTNILGASVVVPTALITLLFEGDSEIQSLRRERVRV